MCCVPDVLKQFAASFFSIALSRERVFQLLDRVLFFIQFFFNDSLLSRDQPERVDFLRFTVKIYRMILSLEAPNYCRLMWNTGKCKSLDESSISRGVPCCFSTLPVCVYKSSSHYLNNIIFIDNSLGPLARESPCIF